MHFASDNSGPVHPHVLRALEEANQGWAMPYGNDDITRSAITAIRDLFEAPDALVYFVATGTAANALLLAGMCQPWDTVFCAPAAHIHVDECNAPEFFAGGIKVLPVNSAEEDKITAPELLQSTHQFDASNIHNPGLGALSITQLTERGRVYTLEEIRCLTTAAHKVGLTTHLDGARFANAAVALDCTPAEMSWKSGIDAVSFGGTKNGMMGVEAAIVFNLDLAHTFERRRKRAGHLFSKNRFLAAQMLAYTSNNLWRDLALRANAVTAQLVECLNAHPDVKLHTSPQANMVYAWFPRGLHKKISEAGVQYYIEQGSLHGSDPDELLQARFVCDWSTSTKEISEFASIMNA